jgi:hypothetical protein
MLTPKRALSLAMTASLVFVLVPVALTTTAQPPGEIASALTSAAGSNAGWREVGAGSASGGGISDDDDDSCGPSIAIAPDCTPYVAWTDRNHLDKHDRDIYVRRWNGSDWEEVGAGSASGGGISGDDGYASGPSVAIAADGTPYIAWDNDTEIYIRYWDGDSWQEVGAGSASGGGISNTRSWSAEASLATAPDGTPYVAWADEGNGHFEIYVRRWSGSDWEEVGTGSASGGGISGDGSFSYSPSIAIAPDGSPYVAWTDYAPESSEYQIYIRRWNGSIWEEVGAGSASRGALRVEMGDLDDDDIVGMSGGWERSFNLSASGEVTVSLRYKLTQTASYEDDELSQVLVSMDGTLHGSGGNDYVAQIVGDGDGGSDQTTGWQLFEVSLGTLSAGSHTLVIGGYNSKKTYSDEMTEVLIDDVLAQAAAPLPDTLGPPAAMPGTGPFYRGTSVEAVLIDAHFDAGTDGFSYVDDAFRATSQPAYASGERISSGGYGGGGISDTTGLSGSPSLAIAPDGTPYVAWQDRSSGDSEIYIRRWNGSGWEEVGAGSASGGGISDSPEKATIPSLAIAPDGTPYVAWEDEAVGDAEIYVRRWNGSNWEEVMAGSASGGGISHTTGWSALPSLAVTENGTPYVTWSELGLPDQIFVRQGPPALGATPTALLFLAEVGAADPTPQHIAVGSTGDVITWTATVSPTVGWLDVTPMAGTTPATITATVTISGLAVDHYTAQIVVDGGEEVLDSPQAADVRLIVAEEIHRSYLPVVLRGH